LNRTKIVPSERVPLGLGTMEGFNYTANLTAFSDRFNKWPKLVDELGSSLDATPAIRGGASETAQPGCTVRLLASAAQDLTSTTQMLWALIRRRLLQLPPLDFRKY
jgi:urease accessory protein UreH